MSKQIHNGYCHMTPGRLRVRVTHLKNKRVAAKSLELLVSSQPGVEHVGANPVTGNVLVKFDPEITSCGSILQNLEDLGHLPMLSDERQDMEEIGDWFAEMGFKLGTNLAKVALKQALVGSSAAILLELF